MKVFGSLVIAMEKKDPRQFRIAKQRNRNKKKYFR